MGPSPDGQMIIAQCQLWQLLEMMEVEKQQLLTFVKENYSKMNPLIIDMKTKNPYFPFIIKFLNKLGKIKKIKFFKKILY